MAVKHLLALMLLVLVSCDCESSRAQNRYFNDLKYGDDWNPPSSEGVHIQSSTRELTNYRIYRGLDADIFVAVKGGKVVSVWRTPNVQQ